MPLCSVWMGHHWVPLLLTYKDSVKASKVLHTPLQDFPEKVRGDYSYSSHCLCHLACEFNPIQGLLFQLFTTSLYPSSSRVSCSHASDYWVPPRKGGGSVTFFHNYNRAIQWQASKLTAPGNTCLKGIRLKR